MSQPDDPDDTVVLGPEDLPPELAEQIEQAISDIHLPLLVDHSFLIERARAAGWDAKHLLKYYPTVPEWARQEMLDGKVYVDARGFLHRLH